ncbi:MAG TPA: M48 family metallopeptidase [Actinomycetota bacterium]|nr:M48 family metallopeptidase [Actinomycetota bacterium]
MFDLIKSNMRRSWLLMAGFVLVVAAFGYLFGILFGGGFIGLVIAIVIAVIMSWSAYLGGDKVVLAVSRARLTTPADEPRLHNLVEGLAIAAGIPKPEVYVVEDPSPNAFATGRDPEHASIAVTRGLLEKMNRLELEGVVAHELAHIANRDTRVLLITATLVGVVVLIADWTLRSFFWGFGGGRRGARSRDGAAVFALVGLVAAVLMPLFASLMQAAVSRRREALADLTGVKYTRYPPGMIAALEKLKADQTIVQSASRATASLWIESPLQRESGFFGKLNHWFDTHPPLDERIRILQEL